MNREAPDFYIYKAWSPKKKRFLSNKSTGKNIWVLRDFAQLVCNRSSDGDAEVIKYEARMIYE